MACRRVALLATSTETARIMASTIPKTGTEDGPLRVDTRKGGAGAGLSRRSSQSEDGCSTFLRRGLHARRSHSEGGSAAKFLYTVCAGHRRFSVDNQTTLSPLGPAFSRWEIRHRKSKLCTDKG